MSVVAESQKIHNAESRNIDPLADRVAGSAVPNRSALSAPTEAR